MSGFAARQLAVLEGRLSAYAEGSLSLNSLISDIEGLANVIEDKVLSEHLSPLLFDLEEINAYCIVYNDVPSPDGVEKINASLAEIKQLFHDVLARAEGSRE
ncbi:MAG: hypothetical protein IKX21_07560 [Deltaproteobacteria bacterium]|nr:hypothetical protein [Deltaproteobacteria bacterium]